jgi:ABC-2 type transport system permease protein
MIVSLRRLLHTERTRLLLVIAAVMLWNFLLLAVFKEAGAGVFKGTQDMGAISKGFDIRTFTNPDSITANLIAIAFTHPLFLAMAGSIALALGARSCAGEMQAGTLELTLSRPITRTSYLLSYMAFIALSLLVVMAVVGVTVLVAIPVLGTPGSVGTGAMVQACFQAWLLFWSLGALATLISTLSRSRSSAFMGSVVLLVGVYFLEFFARIWEPLEVVGPLSPFHFFNPTDTLLGLGVSWGDSLTLIGIAIGANLLALLQFGRRDLV